MITLSASPEAADASGAGEAQSALHAELIAVLVAVAGNRPCVLALSGGEALPSGPLEPGHRSLQSGLRSWVERQTHHPIGHVEQLYTFADSDRSEGTVRSVSISYLALTRIGANDAGWRDWYGYFPWEDQRTAAGLQAAHGAREALLDWAGGAPEPGARVQRRQRCAASFGLDGVEWDEELVLQRYELLYEAGLVDEAGAADGTGGASGQASGQALGHGSGRASGRAMLRDHRRILATGIARLRARIKYRPVVFELMPESFTLLQLQLAFEALAGRRLHKQNFRRLIEQQRLVEETGVLASQAPGRPAKLFRFRREVLQARQAAGSKLPLARVG